MIQNSIEDNFHLNEADTIDKYLRESLSKFSTRRDYYSLNQLCVADMSYLVHEVLL